MHLTLAHMVCPIQQSWQVCIVDLTFDAKSPFFMFCLWSFSALRSPDHEWNKWSLSFILVFFPLCHKFFLQSSGLIHHYYFQAKVQIQGCILPLSSAGCGPKPNNDPNPQKSKHAFFPLSLMHVPLLSCVMMPSVLPCSQVPALIVVMLSPLAFKARKNKKSLPHQGLSCYLYSLSTSQLLFISSPFLCPGLVCVSFLGVQLLLCVTSPCLYLPNTLWKWPS